MPEKLRMRFSKTGRAIWLSHLDLMRTMQRAFLRAGYPLKYSEGFNPHAQISILLPLSVGVSSVCELMDFQLRDDVDLAELPSRLTAVMPEGIAVQEAYLAENKAKYLKWLQRISPRFIIGRKWSSRAKQSAEKGRWTSFRRFVSSALQRMRKADSLR